MNRHDSSRGLKRTWVIGAVLALGALSVLRADDGGFEQALRILTVDGGYQPAPQHLHSEPDESYRAAPGEAEPSRFTTAELRRALTATSEREYVDVARFRGLSRRTE